MPNIETVFLGYTISWNIMIPAMILPGILFTVLALYPFIEAWVTGDKKEHHLLDRPRNAPTRTALGAMAISFYLLLFIGGGNDVIAANFNLSINSLIWFLRIAVIVVPPIVFIVTKRICLGLQRRDRDKLLHGYESGRILRLPHGEFIEVHQPISQKEMAIITSKTDITPLPAPEKTDANGVRNPNYRLKALRAKLSGAYYDDNIALPTAAEIEEGQHHAAEVAAVDAPFHEYEEEQEIRNFHGGVLHHAGMPETNAEQIAERESH
jgi:ubiquinol-cytochrome c reductase cytochrome b subunit